jgi:DNA-binding NtrC family response regulator
VVTLSLPPLADRREDIALLANHFLPSWPPNTASACLALRPRP